MSLSQPQPQLQHQPPINLDDGKRNKLDKKITEEELRRSSEQEVVVDEVSSFEEIMVQKKLVKEGKIKVVENPRFLMEARRKELERRRKEESTPVVKEEKKKFSLFPHHHHRSESQAAAEIQVAHLPFLFRPNPLLPKRRVLLPKVPILLQNRAVLLRKAGLSVA
jgi:hypothetical protein